MEEEEGLEVALTVMPLAADLMLKPDEKPLLPLSSKGLLHCGTNVMMTRQTRMLVER